MYRTRISLRFGSRIVTGRKFIGIQMIERYSVVTHSLYAAKFDIKYNTNYKNHVKDQQNVCLTFVNAFDVFHN